jgi:hypothetical protein
MCIFNQPTCVGCKYLESHSMWSMLYPSAALSWGRLEMLNPSTATLHTNTSDVYTSAAPTYLEFAVRGADTTDEHPTSWTAFLGICGDDKSSAWHHYYGIALRHAEYLHLYRHCCDTDCHNGLPVFADDILELRKSCDLMSRLCVPHDVQTQRLHCYNMLFIQ